MQPYPQLETAVDALLCVLDVATVQNLCEAPEDHLESIQTEFAEGVCSYWDVDEEDLLILCGAENYDEAAATLVHTAWLKARKKLMH